MFVEEFCKARIFDCFQLLKLDNELYLFDKDVASAFDVITNNTSFIEYIKTHFSNPNGLDYRFKWQLS